jgi:hypothetical protein
MNFNLFKFFESLAPEDLQDAASNFVNDFPFGFLTADNEREATVAESIQPGQSGRVKFQGTWWPARCQHNLKFACGEVVRVVGIHDITLLVEPASIPAYR